jgi:HTH-type transcriptional regulator / antitoxin HipB
MHDAIQPLIHALRAARKKKSLSQRALAALLHVSQGRLSKIENGATDLRTSSLLELARTLDMEVMLIPRQWVPAVKSLTAAHNRDSAPQQPAYSLDDDHG